MRRQVTVLESRNQDIGEQDYSERPSLYVELSPRRGTGRTIIALARKLLGIIYYTLKNNWVFQDFPNFILREATA